MRRDMQSAWPSSSIFTTRSSFMAPSSSALLPTCSSGSRFSAMCATRSATPPFSANDIEHGVLRDNATSPASVGALIGVGFLKKPQFKEGDKRRALCVSPVDPRIHFALVCGAKSCPPIKLYTPDNLNDGLQVRPSSRRTAHNVFCTAHCTVCHARRSLTFITCAHACWSLTAMM